MNKIKKTILFFLLTISMNMIFSQNLYISPGIRIGYNAYEGFIIGSEITIGVFGETGEPPYHTSIAIGKHWLLKNKKSIIYYSVQGGYFFFGGSIGKAFLFENKKKYSGIRIAGYSGIGILFLSYENFNFSEVSTKYDSFGVWGKLPIILSECCYWFL